MSNNFSSGVIVARNTSEDALAEDDILLILLAFALNPAGMAQRKPVPAAD